MLWSAARVGEQGELGGSGVVTFIVSASADSIMPIPSAPTSSPLEFMASMVRLCCANGALRRYHAGGASAGTILLSQPLHWLPGQLAATVA